MSRKTLKATDLANIVAQTTKSKAVNTIGKIGSNDSDIDKVIPLNINKIMVRNFARIKNRSDLIDRMVEEFATIGVQQMPTVRKVQKGRDIDIPNGIEYILVNGAHRFEAMRIRAKADPSLAIQEFKLISSSKSKNDIDDIERQFSENNTRASMHLVEIGRLAQFCLDKGNFASKGLLANFLHINNSTLSRALRCARVFSDDDFALLLDWNIDNERSLLSIAKLIEEGENWVQLIKAHALDDSGLFDPKKINTATVLSIENSLNNRKNPKSEIVTSKPTSDIESNPRLEPTGNVTSAVSATTDQSALGSEDTFDANKAAAPVQHKENEVQTNKEENQHDENELTQLYQPKHTDHQASSNPACFDENLKGAPTGQKARIKQDLDMFLRGIVFATESTEIANDFDGFINSINEDDLVSHIKKASDSNVYQALITRLAKLQ